MAPQIRTCRIVKPGNHCGYAELLASIPDLDVPDLSGGVDAMRLAGAPEGAEMAHWTPTARYGTGVTDQTAQGSLDGHLGQRYGESTGAVRSAGVSAVHRGQNFLA